MNPLSLLTIISSIIFFCLGFYGYNAGKLEPGSKLYRLFLLLCLCFSIWGFSFAFLHSATSRNEIEIWYNISSIGWCMYTGFIIHSIILMVGKESVFKNKWVYVAIYAPGIIFTLREFTGSLYAVDFIRVGYGFSEVPHIGGIWFWLFVIHQTGCELLGLFLLFFWRRRSLVKREKKQARIMIITTSTSLVLAFTSDILLPAMNIFIVPSLSPVFLLFWGYGIWYSISRYKFMSLSLAFSSDEITSRMKDLFFILDLDGNIIKINHQVTDLLGFDEKNILHKPIFDILKDSRTLFEKYHYILENHELCFETDNEFYTAKNEAIPVTIHGSLLCDKFNDPISLVIIAIDLREKIQLERETKERALSEEKYRIIVENIKESYYELDKAGNFTFINQSMSQIFGRTMDELIGLNYRDYLPGDTADFVFTVFNRVFTLAVRAELVEIPIYHKDGTLRYIEISVDLRTGPDGAGIGFRGMVRDTTARKEIEDALRRSEEKYRTLLKTNNVGYFEVDLSGNFISCNDVGESFLGFKREELFGTNFSRFMTVETVKKVFTVYNSLFKKEIALGSVDYDYIRKDGTRVYVESTVSLITDRDGNPTGFRAIAIDVTNKKIIESALRESEERYRLVMENINDAVFICKLDGHLKYMSPSMFRLTGYSADEITNVHYLHFIHEDYRKRELDLYIQQVLEDVEVTEHEYPFIAKGDRIIWVGQNVRMVKNDKAEIEFFGVIRDISERKAAEEALKRSEEKYRHLIENANEIIYKSDWRGNFIYSNPACQKMSEYTNEEINHMNYLDLIPSDYRDSEFAFYKNQLINKINESHHELPILTKSGKILWIEQSVKSIKDETGRIIEFDVIVHNITERKAAEDALRKSEMHYQQLMENVTDCVWICKLDGHFKYINPAVTRFTGIPQKDLIGKHILSLVHPEYHEQIMKLYQKQVNENIEITFSEFPILAKNDEIIWAGQTVRMIRNFEGDIEFYGITRDITTLKKAEDARRDLEEAKTRFFSNISHEIRTPLTLMLGPIESVLQGNYDSDVGSEFFENLHRNTISLLKLVNNLLDFSKIEAGKMTMKVQEGDIVSFARSYITNMETVGKTRDIEMSFSSSADSILLYFDPERMDKVLLNLLSNAFKFTGTGGVITITVSEDVDHCRIIVADTGEGIPEKSLGAIFERFGQADTASTRKHSGTGIGLALAKELVEMHDGTITAESRYIAEYPDNHGSIFTITLPKGRAHFENRTNIDIIEKIGLDAYVRDYRTLGICEMAEIKNDATASANCENIENSAIPRLEKSILVVDDNVDMRNFLKILLQKKYRIILAENGEEGIRCARSHRPDLIVTDVMMPVMSGFEMTSIIKNDNELKTTPVIMLTADTELINKVAGLEFGADDYLHKPFNSLELMTRISSLLKNYEYQQIISRRNHDIEKELDVARMLQLRLLPGSLPDITGFNMHVVYIPMDKVGGDFYSIERREDCIDIFIADVSGHGLPGAFLATVTKMAFEHITTRTTPDKVLYLLNEVIHQHTVHSNFVTAFYSIIDIKTRIMRYSSAGHVQPLLYRKRNNEFIEFKIKGTLLGIFENIQIEEKMIQLGSGDRVVFYTDGITECTSPAKMMFGEIRFRESIREHAGKTAEEFSRELIKELEEFKGGKTFDDDITMVLLDVQ